MKIAVFSTKPYDKKFLLQANEKFHHKLVFFEVHLNADTVKLAAGFDAVCAFVNDTIDHNVIKALADNKIKLITLRCAGFNNVDLEAAQKNKITILRVPAYSPHGVAEHTFALMLALNRRIHRAHNRVHEGNFSLEGLLGFEFHGLTLGIIGTGKIGVLVSRIAKGFGMNVLAYDPIPSDECLHLGVKYVSLKEIYKNSDVISLHVPLMPKTYHIINNKSVSLMKKGVMIINTSRGGLIDTKAVIENLKTGKIGYLGLDVYEEEGDLFFEDLSGHVLQDDIFARLLTFPNVVITGHQAFFTQNALSNIADTTLKNAFDFNRKHINPENLVSLQKVKK